MFYKDQSYLIPENEIDFITDINPKSEFKTSGELPDLFESPNFYDFFLSNCQEYVTQINKDNFIEAEETLNNLINFFKDNYNILKENKKNKTVISNISGILTKTSFLQALFSAVLKKDIIYIRSCALFISAITYFFADIAALLSEADFITPLLDFYMNNYDIITNIDRYNIFMSINNLLDFYKDRTFSVIISNSNPDYNFHCIYEKLSLVVEDKLMIVKFYYNVIKNAELITEMYPTLLGFFQSILTIGQAGENNWPYMFNYTLSSLHCMLKKGPEIMLPLLLYKTDILYILNDMHLQVESCRNFSHRYYSFVGEIIKFFNHEAFKGDDFERREKAVFSLINVDELINFTKSNEYVYNVCILNLCGYLCDASLFGKLFLDASSDVVKNIFDFFIESNLDIKKKTLIFLTKLLRYDFDSFSHFVVHEISTSLLCDFIESDDLEFQSVALNFIETVFDNNKTPVLRDFAFILKDDDELMEAIHSLEFKYDEAKKLKNKILLHIRFYEDS